MRLRQVIGITAALVMLQPAYAAEDPAIVSKFAATGVSRVVLRASDAENVTVRLILGSMEVGISGVPSGGAKGYHSPDPNWKETPASDWGMKFVGQRFGSTLVISSMNETRYIHHRYTIQDIVVELPQGIELKKENRQLSGDGAPDLREP
jgi:hypothetical protein